MITPDSVLNAMAGSYMNRWRLDDSGKQVWRDGLSGFDSSTLAHALNFARIDFPEWPPTLMEFRRYCLRKKNEGESDLDRDNIFTWNKWAEQHGLEGRKPGEGAETFRRRLVVQYDMRNRNVYGNAYWQLIEENRRANIRMDWARELRSLKK